MQDVAVTFDDGQAYENFMGRWSRALGTEFVEWLARISHTILHDRARLGDGLFVFSADMLVDGVADARTSGTFQGCNGSWSRWASG